MTVSKNDIKKYLQVGCRIRTTNGWAYTVAHIDNDYVIVEHSQQVSFNYIHEIVSYKIPTDIETNKAYLGHFVNIRDPQKKFPSYWKVGEWAKITAFNHLKYRIDIRYLNTDSHTSISINEIAEYNPFAQSSIKFEEQKFGVTEEWLTGSVNKSVPGTILSNTIITNEQAMAMQQIFTPDKTKLDFANLLNSQKIVLDQYN